MMFYAIDSIEDGLAVLACDDGSTLTVPLSQLPDGAAVHDVLTLSGERYVSVPEEKEQRQEWVRRMQERLKRKP